MGLFNGFNLTILIALIILIIASIISVILTAIYNYKLKKQLITFCDNILRSNNQIKQRTTDITLFDKRIDIFTNLNMIIRQIPHKRADMNIAYELGNKAYYLFPSKYSVKIIEFISTLFKFMYNKTVPTELLKKHKSAYRVRKQDDMLLKIKSAFVEELDELRKECNTILDISGDDVL